MYMKQGTEICLLEDIWRTASPSLAASAAGAVGTVYASLAKNAELPDLGLMFVKFISINTSPEICLKMIVGNLDSLLAHVLLSK